MTTQLTEIALQMLGTIERMELIIPEITSTIRKALEEKAALTKPVPSADGEVAELVNHLLKVAAEDESDGCTYDSAFTRRAAELLERLAPQPVMEGPTDAKIERNAARYRWIKSKKVLTLQSDGCPWFHEDGRKYYPSHFLNVNGTGFNGIEHLDDLIDQAMELYP